MEIQAVDAVPRKGDDDETLAARAAKDFEAFATSDRRRARATFKVVCARSARDDAAVDITGQVFFEGLINAATWRAELNCRQLEEEKTK